LPNGALVRPHRSWSDRRHRRPVGPSGARRRKYGAPGTEWRRTGQKGPGGRIDHDGMADASPASGGREANGGTRVMVKELARPTTPLRRGAAPDTAWAFFNGEFVPLRDAKVSVLTHAFNYGTGVFEGIRAYWNPEHRQLYGLHL